jgi:hypothetical protein
MDVVIEIGEAIGGMDYTVASVAIKLFKRTYSPLALREGVGYALYDDWFGPIPIRCRIRWRTRENFDTP